MVSGMVRYLSKPAEKKDPRLVNAIPGWVDPADMVEIKRIVGQMGLEYILFPDTSGVLNRPLTGDRLPVPGWRNPPET